MKMKRTKNKEWTLVSKQKTYILGGEKCVLTSDVYIFHNFAYIAVSYTF